jgi:cytochrome b pre-mRNA-processing protein 3
MISLPFPRLRRDPTIDALYGAIVAQARSMVFYQDYGVPDTVPARLDMIMMHLVLVLRRLRASPETQDVAQRLFDHFCRDIDHNFREMGVGDLAVPKHMRRVGSAFYGRAQVYDAALNAGDTAALAAALARNVYDSAEPSLGCRRLAAYMQEAVGQLGTLPTTAVVEGGLVFPDPAAVVGAKPQGEAKP